MIQGYIRGAVAEQVEAAVWAALRSIGTEAKGKGSPKQPVGALAFVRKIKEEVVSQAQSEYKEQRSQLDTAKQRLREDLDGKFLGEKIKEGCREYLSAQSGIEGMLACGSPDIDLETTGQGGKAAQVQQVRLQGPQASAHGQPGPVEAHRAHLKAMEDQKEKAAAHRQQASPVVRQRSKSGGEFQQLSKYNHIRILKK